MSVKRCMIGISNDIGWWAAIGIVSCCWKKPFGAMAIGRPCQRYSLFAGSHSRSNNPMKPWFGWKTLVRMKGVALFERLGEMMELPRYCLVLGLAPGGTVVAWILNRGENAIEVGRLKAKLYDDKEPDYTQWVNEYLERESGYLKKRGEAGWLVGL